MWIHTCVEENPTTKAIIPDQPCAQISRHSSSSSNEDLPRTSQSPSTISQKVLQVAKTNRSLPNCTKVLPTAVLLLAVLLRLVALHLFRYPSSCSPLFANSTRTVSFWISPRRIFTYCSAERSIPCSFPLSSLELKRYVKCEPNWLMLTSAFFALVQYSIARLLLTDFNCCASPKIFCSDRHHVPWRWLLRHTVECGQSPHPVLELWTFRVQQVLGQDLCRFKRRQLHSMSLSWV